MSEWKEYKLGDCIEAIIDNRGKSAPTRQTGRYPLLEINSIGGYYPNYDVVRKYVDEATYKTWFRSGHPASGDILIPTVGTIGIISIMDDTKACIAQNIVALRIKKDISNVFIYYYLNNPIVKKELLNLDIGGVQPSIKVPHLLNLSVFLPPKEIQNNITAILSSLDDKIVILHRENATLEALAETLFRHYFIENPNPEWKEGKLGEVCYYVTDKIDAAGLDRHSYISTENMLNEKKGVTDASSIPDNIRVTKYVVGDVLVSNIRPYFKKIWFADRNGGCSNDVLSIRAVNKEIESFVYYTLRQDDFFDYVMLGSKGCKMPRGDKQHIMNWQISVPDKGALTFFDEQVSTSIKKIKLNQQQIQILSIQRDSLLPRLMTGEVKISGQYNIGK